MGGSTSNSTIVYMLFYLEDGPLSHLILIGNFLVADQLAIVKWKNLAHSQCLKQLATWNKQYNIITAFKLSTLR